MSSPPNPASQQLADLQNILLTQERLRLDALEAQTDQIRAESLARLQALQAELKALREQLTQTKEEHRSELARLQAIQEDVDALVTRLTPTISGMVRDSIRNSPQEMAEALGPVMGEAIRVQIRDSRQEMVDAIYPIIGATIQKAIGEFARELQQNIDARFRVSMQPQDLLRLLSARLRGVSAGQVAFRDALPFSVREIFLVQRHSGLLAAHSHPQEAQASDADLISNMLTAIRDFAQDAYGSTAGEGELDEIQYGSQRILLVSGAAAYLAVVIAGIEPEGFRARLREFVADLHLLYAAELRNFDGNPATLPNLSPALRHLEMDLQPAAPSARPLSPPQKWVIVLLSAGSLLLLALACFYLQFTLALLPVAFPAATLTASPSPSQTITLSPTPSPTNLPPTLTITPSLTPRPSLTPLPQTITLGAVWIRQEPNYSTQPFAAIPGQTPVLLLQSQGGWALIQWQTANGQTSQGWVGAQWLQPLP